MKSVAGNNSQAIALPISFSSKIAFSREAALTAETLPFAEKLRELFPVIGSSDKWRHCEVDPKDSQFHVVGEQQQKIVRESDRPSKTAFALRMFRKLRSCGLLMFSDRQFLIDVFQKQQRVCPLVDVIG
jgi:hypothetical protein